MLVATDRASRGVDFARAAVDHVILFDWPRDASECVSARASLRRSAARRARGGALALTTRSRARANRYMRRVGRTARAGRLGQATVLVSGSQVPLARGVVSASRSGARLHRVPRTAAARKASDAKKSRR